MAGAFTDADLGRLVLVDQTELPSVIVDRVAWLPDSRHVVVGGWLEWPAVATVTLVPNDLPALQSGLPAASPHFALAPDGTSLLLWKKVRIGQQDQAELNLVRLDNQMVLPMGEPLEISPALHLLWLAGGPICYTTEDPKLGALLWAVDPGGGKARQVFAAANATWQDLTAGAEAGSVLCLMAGDKGGAYVVNAQTGKYLPVAKSARALRAPDGSGRALEIDATGALILTLSETDGMLVDRGVRAAQWRPDGQAVLYVKDHELALATVTGRAAPRVLMSLTGAEASTFLRGCSWSGDGVSLAVWGVSGSTGRAWRASLGQERVTARFSFPKDAPVKAGSRLWVVTRYRTDSLGRIIEPLWSTLKACFVVTRILRTPEGIVAEAASSGPEAGVVERVGGALVVTDDDSGHIRIGVQGQTATAWTRTRTMRFREGLRGWLEKTQYDSEPLSLNVERYLLPPIEPAPK
jgi:hypothetical protein